MKKIIYENMKKNIFQNIENKKSYLNGYKNK